MASLSSLLPVLAAVVGDDPCPAPSRIGATRKRLARTCPRGRNCVVIGWLGGVRIYDNRFERVPQMCGALRTLHPSAQLAQPQRSRITAARRHGGTVARS